MIFNIICKIFSKNPCMANLDICAHALTQKSSSICQSLLLNLARYIFKIYMPRDTKKSKLVRKNQRTNHKALRHCLKLDVELVVSLQFQDKNTNISPSSISWAFLSTFMSEATDFLFSPYHGFMSYFNLLLSIQI